MDDAKKQTRSVRLSFVNRIAILRFLYCLASVLGCMGTVTGAEPEDTRSVLPNVVFVLTDDHRWDSYGMAGLQAIQTPNLDRIADRGTRFQNAFVTLAICSPSRAACLTGRYGSANGVTSFGKVALNESETTFAHALRKAGYTTGVAGKWHLKTTPEDCGFDFASTCWSNGTWYDRRFTIDGETKTMPGFVDDVTADESIRFIDESVGKEKPFVLWMCTQVPHMDHRHTWPAKQEYLERYPADEMPLPKSWDDSLEGKPEYLASARNRTRGQEYGYDDPSAIRSHIRDYRASVEQMDAAVGRVLDEIHQQGIDDNTWVIFMGDNGWFLGEHGMTSKVLPYEESMRVPMAIAGPSTKAQLSDALVLNIDVTATIYELAGLSIPADLHGRSLLPIIAGNEPKDWRQSFLYEAPTPQLGSQPLWAVRNKRWKYIETETRESEGTAKELYDLDDDADELRNLAARSEHRQIVERLAAELRHHRKTLRAPEPQSLVSAKTAEDARTDIQISGVYPHLTTYGVYSQDGAHFKGGHNECGIGAIVPWAGKLWMVNYAPHMPRGSEHKLFSVDEDLSQPMTVHPESVGGTPAGRMIHAESKQLLIGHHLVDAHGNVRTIQPADMPMRVTAIARHLKDPANMVYYIDMEGSIWEANVHTLAVKRLFKKPVPGWHSKGGYTSQGKLVVSNNGELHVGDYADVLVGGKAENDEERGVLAQWDGNGWQIVERRQFTEVTGPHGITGGSNGDDPIWSMGWDRRSVRLKLLEAGNWHTYLLPKASYCNDASHGWYTEWPRIREITDGRWMMDMHGMFFDFPKSFSVNNSRGLVPIGSHLRYVPDFCNWNGRLVLATDETSIQGNPLAGQPQSNLWFGTYGDLKEWGPANGYGGPWVDDEVSKETWSEPFLVAGFEQRTLHLGVGRKHASRENLLRATDQQRISSIPESLAALPMVTIKRGDWHKPAAGYSFEINQPATVFLAVDQRGAPELDRRWVPTDMELRWGKNHRDRIYKRDFSAGAVQIPANDVEHTKGAFGMPHTAFVSAAAAELRITPSDSATVTNVKGKPTGKESEVRFAVQIDVDGTNQWTDFDEFVVADGKGKSVLLPQSLDAVWMRFKVDKDCVATAFLHQTSSYPNHNDGGKTLFEGLADVHDSDVTRGLVYAAKRNRNLRMITDDDRFYEFDKNSFHFRADGHDESLKSLLEVEPEFSVDAASVVVESLGKRYRLPKGDAAYDKPFTSGWPRAVREVESERHLANIHGTFYELPLITNGAPPAWNLIRPVSSHRKQISDFCSWNGLLVLCGVKADAIEDGHVFRDSKNGVGLWFGGVDDLWKLGKPIGNGGPWKDSPVRANVPSDPYLMRGYDQKTVALTHDSAAPVSLTLEVDVDGNGRWIQYERFRVPAGKPITHTFPAGYSACWVRAVSESDTVATVDFEYR